MEFDFLVLTTIVEWCCKESNCILFFCWLEYGTTFGSMREWEALCKAIMKMRWYFVRPFLITFPTASSLVDVFHFTGPALNDESFLRTPRYLPDEILTCAKVLSFDVHDADNRIFFSSNRVTTISFRQLNIELLATALLAKCQRPKCKQYYKTCWKKKRACFISHIVSC